ncbi:ferredoxin--NADP reductase [Vibrio makurazakiensis]|uniref:ferredoxin--NADP reductase n=1 Tax=Vibrio makurazakiensis TaxID=2910250 RepID=UPI003D0FC31A
MPEVPHGLVLGKVTKKVDWNEQLFTLYVQAPVADYIAGQFTKLALPEGDDFVRRAYSMVNAPVKEPVEPTLEFLIIKDQLGQLSPKLHTLEVGDDVYVGKAPSGFMTLQEIPKHVEELWMLSTGTAVGPFLAMLEELVESRRFRQVVLVHAVRQKTDLTYTDRIEKLDRLLEGKLHYVPVVSREPTSGSLRGRIPDLLLRGELQRAAQLDFSQERSFFYLCGNPAMVRDTSEALKQLGFTKHLRKKPGHFSSENYW